MFLIHIYDKLNGYEQTCKILGTDQHLTKKSITFKSSKVKMKNLLLRQYLIKLIFIFPLVLTQILDSKRQTVLSDKLDFFINLNHEVDKFRNRAPAPISGPKIKQQMIELLIQYINFILDIMSRPKLSIEQTTQMLKLQQLFHNRYLNPQFLHQLIAIYVKAIEQFNSQYKFMRTYFMDKMQFVLSSPEIVAMLEGGGKITDSIRETIRMTERPIIYQESNPIDDFPRNHHNQEKPREKQQKKSPEDRFKPKPENNNVQIKHTHEEHHYYHYDEHKNNQKGLKIDMKMKLMRQVEQNMKNIHKEVNEADKKLILAEEKVNNITKTQQQLLNQRLAKRKKKLRKKSVQIKAQVVKPDSENQEPEPVIQKEELKEAQRQLTRAIFMFTVRMTEKQREKQSNEAKKNVKGRVKKAKDLDDDEDMLLQVQEQHETEKVQMNMKKNKPIEQPEAATHGRIKTTRRHLDSDSDDDDL